MKNLNQGVVVKFGIFPLLCLLVSCSAISTLRANYYLPVAESDALEGRKIILVLQDERGTKDLLTPAARKDFEGFGGNISFSIVPQDNGFVGLGLYRPAPMVREAFKRRLENEGLQITAGGSKDILRLVIALQRFTLDLVGRKWVAELSYEARGFTGKKMLASQSVKGRAERLKIWGTGDADKVIGQVLTDSVNRLDIGKLFQRAEMF